jgi:NADH:quinone reductase (non-electrogenic)
VKPTRIVVLGGGFGGIAAAAELDRRLAKRRDVEVTLVNADNFFLFTPMLHEVAASDLDITHIVNPIRKLLKHASFFCGEVEAIDLERKRVQVHHGDDPHHHEIEFDHLVVALGSVTNFHGLPGLEERALTMKSLGDAIGLRNRIIASLEEADFECCAAKRRRLLTFVVAGGGFAGVETAAGVHDFVLDALRFYRNLAPEHVRVVLVHSGEVILPELSPKLGAYAQRKLAARGVDVRTQSRVAALDDGGVHLASGETIESCTLVWTAGTSPHPMLAGLPCPTERGRIVVDECLRVPGHSGVWAVGDCAVVPDPLTGRPHPPTAQHALREGRALARNLACEVLGRGSPRPFRFRTIGQLASIGRRTGVAQIFGVNFSGFVAWWMWRTIYLSKLPRAEKKVRVALDWTLDLLFSKDLVRFDTGRSPRASEADARAARIQREGRRAEAVRVA